MIKVEEVLENFRRQYFDLLISNEGNTTKKCVKIQRFLKEGFVADEAFPLREKRRNRFSQLRRLISRPSLIFVPPLRGNLEVERSEVLSMAR